MSWTVVFTNQAKRDAMKLSQSALKPQADKLLAVLKNDPYRNPPPDEKLVGNLSGAYSRRINIQHRLVYEILADIKTVKVMRMWTHYEETTDF